MTYRTLLTRAQKYWDKSYIEYLLQGLTNKKIYELYLDGSAVPKNIIDKFNNLLHIKKSDMPIQYLLHKTYFLSYELYVDERVMIPRFETEEFIIKTAARIKNPKTILDLGTGSGAIAIAMADLLPNAKIIATDISLDALAVAKININHYNMTNRIFLSQSDLFLNLTNDKFDLIISNPPYIPEDEIENLPLSVRNYEPLLALNGGRNGFEIIEQIIKQAPDYLKPNGLLALEIDPRQAESIKCLMSNDKFAMPTAEFEKDNQGLIRYAFILGSPLAKTVGNKFYFIQKVCDKVASTENSEKNLLRPQRSLR